MARPTVSPPADLTDQPPGALVESSTFMIAGDAETVWPIVVRGTATPELYIDGKWTASGAVIAGDTLKLRQQLPVASLADSVATVRFQGGSFTWTARTADIFLPSQLPNLKLLLDAANVTGLSSGDRIALLPDASGFGRNATASGSARPVWQASVASLGNRPAIQIAAQNECLQIGDLSAVFPTAGSVALVFRDTRTSGGAGYSGKSLGAMQTRSNDGYFSFSSGTGYPGVLRTTRAEGVWSEADLPAAAKVLFDDATCIMIFTSSSAGYEVYINGSRIKSGFSADHNGGNAWELGKSSGGASIVGYIPVMLATSDVLSTLNRQKVEGYLAWRYGAAALLPAGHPYRNIAP